MAMPVESKYLKECANCSIHFSLPNMKVVQLNLVKNPLVECEINELTMEEIISAVYDIPTEKIQSEFESSAQHLDQSEQGKNETQFSDSIGLCYDCSKLLSKVYVSARGLEKRRKPGSLINNLLTEVMMNVGENGLVDFYCEEDTETYFPEEGIKDMPMSPSAVSMVETEVSAINDTNNDPLTSEDDIDNANIMFSEYYDICEPDKIEKDTEHSEIYGRVLENNEDNVNLGTTATSSKVSEIKAMSPKKWSTTSLSSGNKIFGCTSIAKMLADLKTSAYKCSACTGTFKCMSHLQKHMIKHVDERPYVCKFCSCSYKRPHHLKEHQILRHPHHMNKDINEGRRHQCLICFKSFTRPSLLNIHLKNFHGAQYFVPK